MDNLALVWGVIGPGLAGAVFGAGWWFWVDAVVCSAVQVSFLHYLPGIFASLAALMFNCVNKDGLGYDYYSPYEDDSEWTIDDLPSSRMGTGNDVSTLANSSLSNH